MPRPFPPAESFFPPGRRSLKAFAEAAQGCRACDLYARATQAVFGEGARGARLVLVGEQPGDVEDREGRPFVGPAGRFLSESLEEAGIPRGEVWLTNAVKHFNWTPSGKRRMHKPPNLGQVNACRPWLLAELGILRPEGIVALGATAARSLLGPEFRITRRRGEFLPSPHAGWVLATYHPSAIVRMPDREKREEARRLFAADLRRAAERLPPREE